MMLTVNPYQQYRTQGVMTASPVELIVMLYDGLIKRIQLARIAIEENKIEAANDALIRAQEIVEELVASLDMSYGISEELLDLYEFWLKALVRANMDKDASQLEDIIEIVSSMREAWATVAKDTRVHMPLTAEE